MENENTLLYADESYESVAKWTKKTEVIAVIADKRCRIIWQEAILLGKLLFIKFISHIFLV